MDDFGNTGTYRHCQDAAEALGIFHPTTAPGTPRGGGEHGANMARCTAQSMWRLLCVEVCRVVLQAVLCLEQWKQTTRKTNTRQRIYGQIGSRNVGNEGW